MDGLNGWSLQLKKKFIKWKINQKKSQRRQYGEAKDGKQNKEKVGDTGWSRKV